MTDDTDSKEIGNVIRIDEAGIKNHLGCQWHLKFPQNGPFKIPQSGVPVVSRIYRLAAPFLAFGGRPLRLGGGGGEIGAFARTCSGIRSA
ncbi:hypothetical protein [Labrenzia sp. OB1]|uniref:hypothetical protein n=1 Tax=Labrenzia sp. OB1 TaxID=1561204 RepID=UPI000B066721|nr:hypothetical protein [Labrenzia sp. OB1]